MRDFFEASRVVLSESSEILIVNVDISGFSIQGVSPGQDGSATSQSEAQRSKSSDSHGNTISNNQSGAIDQQIKRKRQLLHLEWTNDLHSYFSTYTSLKNLLGLARLQPLTI